MSKIYTYFLLLLFISPGRMVFSQCPPEPLLVEFDAYEVKQGVQVAHFNNTNVSTKIKMYLSSVFEADTNAINVTVVTNPPKAHDKGNFYTYCNAKNGFANTFNYEYGTRSGEGCPIVIKVLDKYHPNCGKNKGYNPNFPATLEIASCSPTKEQLDEIFIDVAQKIIAGSQKWDGGNWNDIMYQTPTNMNCAGSGLKEAYIDWENTDISNFRIGEVKDDLLEFQYVLLDNAGNRGLRYEGDVLHPCRAKIKVVRTDYNVNFLCPDQSVLSNTEVVLDLPKVPEGDYIVWNTGSKNLKDPKGKDVNSDLYAWTPAADGISVTDFPKEGVYSLTIKGKVCNKTEKSVTCPVNVVKKVDACDPK